MNSKVFHPYQHAIDNPDRVAFVVEDTGECITYSELDRKSNQVAHLFRSHRLQAGDRAAVILKNCIEFPIVYWGAQKSGIILTLISSHLKTDEICYILNDSHSKLLISSSDQIDYSTILCDDFIGRTPEILAFYDIDQAEDKVSQEFGKSLAAFPSTPIADQISGYHLLYSSGTTGRPKGIAHKFEAGPIENLSPSDRGIAQFQGFDPLVTFNPGPVYHGAPLNTMLLTHRLGGTFVTLRKFDAEAALRAIQRWKVVVGQFVPTMFVRMLSLPKDIRDSYDLSFMQYVSHAAAPCPVEIKRQMMDWLGPIIHEYYSSTENVGATYIAPDEWLRKPGSVGRSVTGRIHICDEETGEVLPSGTPGLIYFELAPGRGFNYINDPEKTKKVKHPFQENWFTPGDIGYLDDEEYLFLTDRKDFTIISGGVNIYPQIIEDTLICHPNVLDVAVIGVPNKEYGEEVKAIIQPQHWHGNEADLFSELMSWCKQRISSVSCPRQFQIVEELPRLPSGKLAKHELRKLYGAGSAW